MSVARDLANATNKELVEADRGVYYLGSTGPDMHVLSRADRLSSHYFDLECLEQQDSVESFFRAHRDLRNPWKLGGSTAAFVAGYLTHLVIDAVWITDIYRPFFGPESALGGDARANVLDRVLQYDMDLQRRADQPAMEEIRDAIEVSRLDVHVDFLENGLVSRWRELAVAMASLPPTWDRFPRTASRFLSVAGVSTPEEVEQFMKTLPQLLEEARRHVGRERVDAFLEKASTLAQATLEEYLT
jgi:hypothetical protein